MTASISDRSDRSTDRRGVVALGVVLVVLLLVLCGLTYFFVRILIPAGVPEQAARSDGMTWVRSIYGFGSSADRQLLGPTAVAVAPDGTIYSTDPQRKRVLAFHPDGTFKGLIQSSVASGTAGQIGRPADIAVDADGQVYVADYGNGKVVVYDDRFSYVREWKVPLALGIDVVDDTVLVRSGGEIVQFALDGTELERFGGRGRGTGALIEPAGGITADAQRVYVADALNQSIKAFDPGGALIWATPERAQATSGSAESTAPVTETSGVQVDLPQDVTLDAAGHLVVVDAFAFGILVLDPVTGKIENRYGQEGQADGQFIYPSSIAYDAARDWFVVADTANNRLQIVRIGGSGGGVVQAAARTLSSPFRACGIPVAALVLALVVVFLTRRREDAPAPEASVTPDAGEDATAE